MINFHKPILAASLLKPDEPHTNEVIYEAMKALRFPVWVTLKKDGIRAIRTNDLLSRTLKLIPNISIRRRSMKLPAGFDCELWNPELSYDEVESIVMSREHDRSDLIQFHGLDWFDEYAGYCIRIDRLRAHLEYYAAAWKDVVFQMPIQADSVNSLFEYFLKVEQEEGEGICFRLGNSPYKQGRSTLREQYLVKLCRYVRTEVTVIGFVEQECNTNSIKRNAIGNMDRASYKCGMIGKDTLGAFRVRSTEGLEFTVGTGVGLTDFKRKEIWLNQDQWLGQKIVIKHKPHGAKVKPRSPIYIGRRSDI